MLIDVERSKEDDDLSGPLLNLGGFTRMQQGVYAISHFNGHLVLSKAFDSWPDLPTLNCYGVCDCIEDVLTAEPTLVESARQFVITMTEVSRADCDERGGWRWHKWGPYIGKQQPTTEYLYDEPLIERVYCYHIFEKKGMRRGHS